MAQIAVTLEQIQHRDDRRYIPPTPVETTIGIGVSYVLTPNGTGTVIMDNGTNTEYTVTENITTIEARLGAGTPTSVSFADSPSIDAFSRLRVSNPETLYDSKNIHNDGDIADTAENLPLFYDNQEVSGGGTATSYDANKSSQTLTTTAATAGKRVRRTKMCFNYQPAKSQLIAMTFNFNGVGTTGTTKREGLFDDNAGIFLEAKDGVLSIVRRSKTSGSVVDTKVPQSEWNVDAMDGNGASALTLDMSKTQIFLITMQWLGVGRVQCAFDIDGMIIPVHEFLNANSLNVVYMQTPNLPLSTELENDGAGEADSITQICSSVISEGGSQELGMLRYDSTDGTHIDANIENIDYAIMGIRLKTSHIGATVKLINASLSEHSGNKLFEWKLLLNPTVADTFTYVDVPQSAIQTAKGATANTVTGGYKLAGGMGASGVKGDAGMQQLENAIRLGSFIDGTVDEMVLAIRPVGGTINLDIEGGLTWRELL